MKNFIVIGLGRFGSSVAVHLTKLGHEVMVVDSNAERVNALADIVTQAVIGNAADAAVVRSLGVRNFDAAIVSVGEHMESSVLTTVLLKEYGAPYIVAKARNELHGTVLEKVGADLIVFPEEEMGERIAKKLSNNAVLDMIEVSENCSIVEIEVPKKWIGKTVRELNVRAKHGINIIAVKSNQHITASVLPETVLTEQDVLIVIGDERKIDKIN